MTSGRLSCPQGCSHPIHEGLPNFLAPEDLTEIELRTRSDYDRVAVQIYDNSIDWQFAATYEDEDKVRESMVDMLELAPGMRVLEVGCGTGRDSFRIARRLGDEGLFHMQDLSPGMVREGIRRITAYKEKDGLRCSVVHSTASASSLPFPDGHFDAVFHFGGFNLFGDLKQAAAELTRVAKIGARIVVGDEAVGPWLKGTEFEGIVTTNNHLFKAQTPIDVLPASARDVELRWIIANCYYVISFRKGDGPPPLNLDLPHQGWRGGSMRSRYFGVLEGVTPETKALVRSAAQKAGVSVHEWLNRVVGSAAASALADTSSDPDGSRSEPRTAAAA